MGSVDVLNSKIQLLFASQNNFKRDELAAILLPEVELITLKDLNYSIELEEDYDTIEENARQKAQFIYHLFNRDCISEDTALEVESLMGEPGVHTAHYAGPGRSASDNMNLLLKNLDGHQHRLAQFRTVICLIYQGKEFLFEGICKGRIAEIKQGDNGFGYDPIFIPEGRHVSFARMDQAEKNAISHRTLAARMLKRHLLHDSGT
ncbi:MAG: RdgB/HAM1 family non-canonical purine NTP pyrophosphatase [Bacteroidota bacterium]|jgi:XTP/dITP diphosphohydrolase